MIRRITRRYHTRYFPLQLTPNRSIPSDQGVVFPRLLPTELRKISCPSLIHAAKRDSYGPTEESIKRIGDHYAGR